MNWGSKLGFSTLSVQSVRSTDIYSGTNISQQGQRFVDSVTHAIAQDYKSA